MGPLTDLTGKLAGYGEAVLDSSVWLALFRGEPAAKDFTTILTVRPVTTPLVIAEVLAHKRLGRVSTNDPLTEMEQGARFEPLTREDAIAGAEAYGRLRRKGHPKVSLADTLIHATARRIGAVLITMDGDLTGEPDVIVCSRAPEGK